MLRERKNFGLPRWSVCAASSQFSWSEMPDFVGMCCAEPETRQDLAESLRLGIFVMQLLSPVSFRFLLWSVPQCDDPSSIISLE